MDYTHLVIFKYDNAYDIESADALRDLHENIDEIIMHKECALIFCRNVHLIEDVMKCFAFTYNVVDVSWADNLHMIKSASNFF